MARLRDLKIRTKLVAAFCAVAVIAGIVGWIGVSSTRDALALQKQIYERNLIPIQMLGNTVQHFQQVRIGARDVQLAGGNAGLVRENAEKTRQAVKKVEEELVGFDTAGLIKFADQREIYTQLMADMKTYREWTDKFLAAAEEGRTDDVIAISQTPEYRNSTKVIADGISKIQQLKSESAAKKNREGAEKGNFAVMLTITLTVAGMILAVILGTIVARLISRQVEELAKKAGQVAEGDLSVNIDVSSRDEIGQLSASFAKMVDSLRTLIGQVGSASDHVASAAAELTSTSEQITSGTQEVASQSSAVATAGEEMATTSKDIARNCQQAVKEGQEASDAAKTGVEVVNRTVEVMARIAERVIESAKTVEDLGSRSHQIGAIINTIQGIADQTNLLALNAAIEAARAGDQGRGFAVVADEVRALSERTTKATSEIGSMIQAIQEGTKTAVAAMEEGVREVQAGTAEAAKSGEALQNILTQISEVTGQVHQVATAAEEQTATTSEISNNMLRISNVVQQAADGAKESTAAANQLARLADELQNLIRRFRVAA